MFVWFAVTAVLAVLLVFDSPAADHRFVAVGGVLPLVEDLTGRPLVLHTLLGAGIALVVVMTLARGRRLVQRRLLGIPIGMLVFLVVSGTWTRAPLFWWPAFGTDGIATGPPPEFDRPLVVLVVLEALGWLGGAWIVRRHGLTRPERRRRFLRTGRLEVVA